VNDKSVSDTLPKMVRSETHMELLDISEFAFFGGVSGFESQSRVVNVQLRGNEGNGLFLEAGFDERERKLDSGTKSLRATVISATPWKRYFNIHLIVGLWVECLDRQTTTTNLHGVVCTVLGRDRVGGSVSERRV
jgi:hypothetical protein